MSDGLKPWVNQNQWGQWEFNTATQEKITVNCGANELIEIDKLYGPLAAFGVRIRLEYNEKCSDWVIERERYKQGTEGDVEWVEVCRWDCQLEWFPEREKK